MLRQVQEATVESHQLWGSKTLLQAGKLGVQGVHRKVFRIRRRCEQIQGCVTTSVPPLAVGGCQPGEGNLAGGGRVAGLLRTTSLAQGTCTASGLSHTVHPF
mgnify:CR=1 FL=1